MLQCTGEDECLLGLFTKEDAELPSDSIYLSRKEASAYYDVCGPNPEIRLDMTCKKEGEISLISSYRPTFWNRKLRFGDDRALNIVVSFPGNENFGYEKADEIEKYLLGIKEINFSEIYKEIVKILGFSAENVTKKLPTFSWKKESGRNMLLSRKEKSSRFLKLERKSISQQKELQLKVMPRSLSFISRRRMRTQSLKWICGRLYSV